MELSECRPWLGLGLRELVLMCRIFSPTFPLPSNAGTELDEGLRVRVAEAQEALRGGFVDRVDMTLLSAVPYAEVWQLRLMISGCDRMVALQFVPQKASFGWAAVIGPLVRKP